MAGSLCRRLLCETQSLEPSARRAGSWIPYSNGFAHALTPDKGAQGSILFISALVVVPDSIVGFEIREGEMRELREGEILREHPMF